MAFFGTSFLMKMFLHTSKTFYNIFLIFLKPCDKSCNLGLLQIYNIKVDWKGTNVIQASDSTVTVPGTSYIAKFFNCNGSFKCKPLAFYHYFD